MIEPKLRSLPCPFFGSMFVVPNDGQTHPGVLMLHGSEGGGYPAWKISAARLAAEGYAVLAYSYFGSQDGLTGPRQTLADIEIGDILKALTWLQKSSSVNGKKVALSGTSRGAELALLAGSFAKEVFDFAAMDAIAVHSPANTVWGSWNHDWTDSRCWLGDVPTYQDLTQAKEHFSWNPKCGLDPRQLPENLRYAWKWQGKPLAEGSRIAVENIPCPIFLSQGLKDSIWPAEQALDIEKSLKLHGNTHEAVFYENDDHWLSLESAYDREMRMLAFLERTLRS